MKFENNKSNWARIVVLLIILLAAPYAVPFAFEFVLVADFFGLEALILLLLLHFKTFRSEFQSNLIEVKEHFLATCCLLAGTYVFQPRAYLSHAAGSSLLIIFTCSVLYALALWIPAIYISAGVMS